MSSLLNVKIIFTEEVLGTASANPEIHAEFIASKAPDAVSMEEEIEAIGVKEKIEKSMTVFPRNKDGVPIFWDYQLKGFFKDSCGGLRRCPAYDSKENKDGYLSPLLKAYKSVIDKNIFVLPRQIVIQLDGRPIGISQQKFGVLELDHCQRPLRADTAQGPRIALANSEAIPAGSSCMFQVKCLNPAHEKYVKEWLDYGKLSGLGAWRNSGKGRFEVEYI
jgi:hypothetical protein